MTPKNRRNALLGLVAAAPLMLANTPAVFLGERITRIVPLNYVRMAAAAIFAAIGVWILIDALQ